MSAARVPVPELAGVRVTGTTRAAFIVRGALAAAAVCGTGVVRPFVAQALVEEDTQDVDVLNVALQLEFLEARFYELAVRQTKGLSGSELDLAKLLRDDEATHVDAVGAAVREAGGTPLRRSKYEFGDAFSSTEKFLKLANTFEDIGVSAYNGAGPQLKNKERLAFAGSIVQVEARHSALVRVARGQPPAPMAFDVASDTSSTLQALKGYLIVA